ncbi:MAG: hypothetical protein R3Y50_01105 [Rikenellaceae bacterium]
MTKTKNKNNQGNFIMMVEEIRQSLTEKIAEISESEQINGENIKLLKEMTSIVKELDKLIKESNPEKACDKNSEIEFLQKIAADSIINNNNKIE